MTITARAPRILLIGVTGQVGRELATALAPLGEIVATARQPAEADFRGEVRAVDLADVASLRKLVRDVRPTLVVNAAAYTAVDRAESDVAAAEALNAIAPGVLAEEAARLDAALVHYSTDYVFDGHGNLSWREDDPPAPLNVYGRTKLAGERAVQASGVPHLILRIARIYAPRGRNFVDTMLRLGSERETIDVVDDQVGAPTPARVVAELTAQILASAEGDFVSLLTKQGGILHATCSGETTWHEFAEAIFRLARASGVPLKVTQVRPVHSCDFPTPAVRPLNSRLDLTRLATLYGLQPPEWSEALAQEFPRILVKSL